VLSRRLEVQLPFTLRDGPSRRLRTGPAGLLRASGIRFSGRTRRHTYEPEHFALRNCAKWGKLQSREAPRDACTLTNGQRMATGAC